MLIPRLRPNTVALMLGAVAAILAWHPVFESDPYWHMLLGREVLRQGTRTVVEHYAHPAFTAPCIVPEWLWDVTVYGMYEAVGSRGLVVWTMMFAGFGTWLVWHAVYRTCADTVATTIVTMAVLSSLAWRFEARPEMAAIPCLAGVLWLRETLRPRSATEAPAKRVVLGLTAITFVWAQVHGSFVLAPALVVPVAVECWWTGHRARVRQCGWALAGMLAASLTSAHGLGVVSYVLAHSGGDATAHILDMKPPTVAAMAPLASSAFAGLALLGTVAVVGALRGAVSFVHWTTALLGVALYLTAHRFAGTAALLVAPAAIQGFVELSRGMSGLTRRSGRIALGLLAALALFASVRSLHRERGPLFEAVGDSAYHPTSARERLRRFPKGTNVFTDYRGGAELAFWLDGRVRTFVDGRTPLYFDDTDMAIARDATLDTARFMRAAERYGWRAAVVERTGSACAALEHAWVPVAADALYTTFVPPTDGELPIPGFVPCGPELVAPNVCEADPGWVLRTAAPDGSPVAGYLAAAEQTRCGDIALAEGTLPSPRALWSLRGPVHAVEVLLHIRRHEIERAQELAEALARSEPMSLMYLAASPALDALPLAAQRSVLEGIAAQMDDETLPWVRSQLAIVCAAQGDASCAKFHAFRAALAGDPAVTRVLEWLAQTAGDPRTRADAHAWRKTLVSPRP